MTLKAVRTEQEPERWWQLDRRGARLRWGLIQLLPGANLPLTVGLVACLVAGAVIPPFLMLSVGWAVAEVGAAVKGGVGSQAAHELTLSLVRVGALFTLLRVFVSMTLPIGDQVSLRVRAGVFQRIINAHLAPASTAHLEDPSLRDLVERAQDPGGIGPRSAVTGLVNRWMVRLGGVGGIVLVGLFDWWAGLVFLAVLVYGVRRMRIAHVDIVRVQFAQNRTLRRSDYLRDLVLLPGAEKEVRVFGLGGWLQDRSKAEWEEAMGRVWERRRHSVREAVVALGPVLVVASGIVALAVHDALADRVGVGELTVVLQAVLVALGCAAVTVYDTMVALGVATLEATIDLEAATQAQGGLSGTRPAAGLPSREIRFEAVHYAYPGPGKDVLADIDLVVPAGKSLAIVGENGAGKTTLIKLLARLADPTAGTIWVDGVDLKDIDPCAWQQRSVAVFQEFLRYPWSAAENIGLSTVPDQDQLEAAARQAGVLDLIQSLPDGWGTRLSRQFGGVDLSGGEWQRIALARALYAASSGSSLLILDEPTAQLDVRQEAHFYNRFLEITGGHTTIVVSHRFASVRRADRIVVMEGGRVTEAGTHDQLVDAGRKYAQLFAVQAERFKDE